MQQYDSTMAPRFLELLKKREGELRALLQSGRNEGSNHEPDSHDVTDFKDMATGEVQAQLAGVQAERHTAELEQVLAAERRIAEKSYGDCTVCGEPIDLRRLLALPATPTCASCQEALEHRQAARPGVHGAH
ncbi:MAG: TraR/DksA family transcriptional regulator [Pseudomonadota bacterium]